MLLPEPTPYPTGDDFTWTCSTSHLTLPADMTPRYRLAAGFAVTFDYEG
jgi:hypothetical protein